MEIQRDYIMPALALYGMYEMETTSAYPIFSPKILKKLSDMIFSINL